MADKRTTELPMGGDGFGKALIWNPFFDDDVQSVLKTRQELNYEFPKHPRQGTNSFLLSWPIVAYKEVIGVAYWTNEAYQGNFFTYYGWDSGFVANLLAAVTRFKEVPESKWDLRRAYVEMPHQEFLAENARQIQGGFPISGLPSGNTPPGDIPPGGLSIYRSYTYREMVDLISENLPHIKQFPSGQKIESKSEDVAARKLRTDTAFKERENRKIILDEWKPNFEAHDRWEIRLQEDDIDYSLLPCLPRPKFYKSPPLKIRHKKPSNK